MRRTSPLLLAALLAAVFAAGCRKEPNDSLLDDLPPYHGAWLLPLVKGDVSMQQIADVQHVELAADLAPDSIGFPSGTYTDVPPIALPPLGPFPVEVADFLYDIEAEVTDLVVTVTNNFPVPMGAGTSIELRNAPDRTDPATLLFDATFSSDLQPGQTFTATLSNEHVLVRDVLYIYVVGFNSPGGHNVTFSNASVPITLTMDIRSVDRVRIRTHEAFTTTDTFDIRIGDDLDGHTDAATGHVTVYADNGLPINSDVQLYFFDGAGVLLDSLFHDTFNIPGGQTDVNGHTTSISSVNDTVPVNADRLERLLDCRTGVIRFNVNTEGYQGPFVAADAAAALHLQLVGDLKLNIDFDEFR